MLTHANFKPHPTQRTKELFYFYDLQKASHFETLLIQQQIGFEKGNEVDEEKEMPVYYYIVRNYDREKARKCNYLTAAHFRKPLIPDKTFRWVVVLFGLSMLTLALIGYFKSLGQ